MIEATDAISNAEIKTLYKAMLEDPRSKGLTTGEHWFVVGCAMGAAHAVEKVPDVPNTRDFFACAAMQAAATNPTGADGFTFEARAEWAYRQADAMMKARGS